METATKTITLANLGPDADRFDLAAFAAELRATAPEDVIVALRSDRIVIAYERGDADAISVWTERVFERGTWVADADKARAEST